MLGHLCHKSQTVQSSFVNTSHLIVDKQAGQQHCQREDLCTVLARLQWALQTELQNDNVAQLGQFCQALSSAIYLIPSIDAL